MNNKHCLIIPCCGIKAPHAAPAIDMYKGTLNEILNSFPREIVFKHFDIFFLSAKLGLIRGDEVIEPYDVEMAKNEAEQKAFALKHQRNVNKTLKHYANKDTKLFTVMFTKYQSAFDFMSLSALKDFDTVYSSRAARGSGDHRGRLNKIIQSHIKSDFYQPTLFRSGCANENEFNGYLGAGEDIGSSLAYIKKPGILNYIIDAIKLKNPVFLDNGLITAVTNGKQINESEIFEDYTRIVKSIRGSQSLSIVIPDNPFDEDDAIEIVKRNKKAIRYLANQCQVILPIHNTVNRTVVEQAKILMSIIGKVPITLGIPCRNKGENKWRMNVQDIESLFDLKSKDKSPVFTKVHFLALSEVSRGGIYQERINLAQIYNKEVTADCCRTTALFGNGEKSNRKGTVACREIESKLEADKLHNKYSPDLASYSKEDEYNEPMIFEELEKLSTKEKIEVWNECFPHIEIEYDDDEEFYSLEAYETCFNVYVDDYIDILKYKFRSLFKVSITELTGPQIREKAIVNLYLKYETHRTPVQQVIGF